MAEKRKLKRSTRDQDAEKGAIEDDPQRKGTQVSMAGQLGHRTNDELIKDYDTDFPEPGSNPEHSGQERTAVRLRKPAVRKRK